MLGIAEIKAIMQTELEDSPITVKVKYTSHQKPHDTIKIEVQMPFFSVSNNRWEVIGQHFFMSEESRCIENVLLLVKRTNDLFVATQRDEFCASNK